MFSLVIGFFEGMRENILHIFCAVVFHSKDIDISSRTINERLKVERMLEYPQREQVYLETDEYMVS